MPEISRFLGVVIAILDGEHAPPLSQAACSTLAPISVLPALRPIAWPDDAGFAPEFHYTQVKTPAWIRPANGEHRTRSARP